MVENNSGYLVYSNILSTRNQIRLSNPIWKMCITDEEYLSIKKCLINAIETKHLFAYGNEAAIYYAEWWRREYNGGIPSKEVVASSLGYPDYSEDLYKTAKECLKKLKFDFIRSSSMIMYFRTLLAQGGIPINYITSGNNFSSYHIFLKKLIHELSQINFDWESQDITIVERLNCVSYLSNAFRNENIYDISIQIAHAIIRDDETLLPYDSRDSSLSSLTNSLRKEYNIIRKERRMRPLSIHWSLTKNENNTYHLWYNIDLVKDIDSRSIEKLNIENCYAFDVCISGKNVARYVRIQHMENDDENASLHTRYTRVNVGISDDILWKGEPLIEVKILCDNEERLFITIPGSMPPNFDSPQLFQQRDENTFVMCKTAHAENNIVIFSNEWSCTEAELIQICGVTLWLKQFSNDIQLTETHTGDSITLSNEINPYIVNYGGTFIDWIESSNYKLCKGVPTIYIYDSEKNPVSGCTNWYRRKGEVWHKLSRSTSLPTGLIQFKVNFPNGMFAIETFYNIQELHFMSSNESLLSTTIECRSCDWASVEVCSAVGLDIRNDKNNSWNIQQQENNGYYTSTCCFHIFQVGMPTLKLEIPIPFDGLNIVDLQGNIVPDKKILSYSNLENFRILCHGKKNQSIVISYFTDNDIDDESSFKRIRSCIFEGITPLTDYIDYIDRIFNLYGDLTFKRANSVSLIIRDKTILVRKFVLDSMYDGEKLVVTDNTYDDKVSHEVNYEGKLLACPVDDNLKVQDYNIVEMKRSNCDQCTFEFPDKFQTEKVIVFSDACDRRRIIPHFFMLQNTNMEMQERNSAKRENLSWWSELLLHESFIIGDNWKIVYKSFVIASKYRLPFGTFNCLTAIAKTPVSLARLILGLWLNGNSGILLQDIDKFEQEYSVGVHWIRNDKWEEIIAEFYEFVDTLAPPLQSTMINKPNEFVLFLQDLFSATLTPVYAQEFLQYVISGNVNKNAASGFSISEVNRYRALAKGTTDSNKDLPHIEIQLNKRYFPSSLSLLKYQLTLINSPICIAEYLCDVDGHYKIWHYENIETRRVINFYRAYFKNIYTEILLKSMGYIHANQ